MGFFSRLLGDRPKPTLFSSTSSNIVVADYGEVLETRAPAPGCVADVTELPYQKDEIKRAILMMLGVITDSQLREHLRFAYVSLADWQVGVGTRHLGLDITKIDRNKLIDDRAKEVLEKGDEMKMWLPIIEAERNALLRELKTFGY